MRFINLLNLTAVTYITDLGKSNWSSLAGMPGWEAINPFGEIRAFATRKSADDWRINEVKAAMKLNNPERVLLGWSA